MQPRRTRAKRTLNQLTRAPTSKSFCFFFQKEVIVFFVLF
jgi:hypothetical protein